MLLYSGRIGIWRCWLENLRKHQEQTGRKPTNPAPTCDTGRNRTGPHWRGAGTRTTAPSLLFPRLVNVTARIVMFYKFHVCFLTAVVNSEQLRFFDMPSWKQTSTERCKKYVKNLSRIYQKLCPPDKVMSGTVIWGNSLANLSQKAHFLWAVNPNNAKSTFCTKKKYSWNWAIRKDPKHSWLTRIKKNSRQFLWLFFFVSFFSFIRFS